MALTVTLASQLRQCGSKLFRCPNVIASLSTSCPLHQDVGSTNTSENELNMHGMTGAVEDKVPKLLSRELKFPSDIRPSRLAWLESLDTLEPKKSGIIDLHPDIFASYPRIDILQKNVHWQRFYRYIDYGFMKSRAELSGGGRKPWPQKGTGRARHGSIRSPLWIRGAKAHGPRGPTSYFYMLPTHQRVIGLQSALTCKFAQNDLVIVESLDIPTKDPEYMKELADVRFWGYSVLFVDDTDIMPENIAKAVSRLRGFTLMPAYGLNVFSMLKHETLVLTLAALERIENKLLQHLHTTEKCTKFVNRRSPEDLRTRPKEDTRMYKKYSVPFHDH